MATTGLIVAPADESRWADLESLFGPSGAYSGCWCTYYRLTGREFGDAARGGGQVAKQILRDLVAGPRPPGLLAYRDGERSRLARTMAG
jgi:hypothetical protein